MGLQLVPVTSLRPNTALLLFQASTQSPSLKTGNTRALQLGNVKLWYNENYSARNTEELLTPAICHLRGLMDTAWQGERAPDSRIQRSQIPFHGLAGWRRPHQRTRGEVGGCLRLWDGYCGVMSCLLERGVMAPSALSRGAEVPLKTKINFNMYMFTSIRKNQCQMHTRRNHWT